MSGSIQTIRNTPVPLYVPEVGERKKCASEFAYALHSETYPGRLQAEEEIMHEWLSGLCDHFLCVSSEQDRRIYI